MDAWNPILTASTDTLPYLGVVGGIVVALSVGLAFFGMKREGFPSGNALRGLMGLMAALVIVTGALAVITAREEQAIRREENEEAAREEEEATEERTEEEGSETEGEAAEPDAGPDASAQPPAGGGEPDTALGGMLFTDVGCGSCHTLATAGSTAQVGPELDAVLPGQSAEMIRTSIVDPSADISEGFPEGVMPVSYGSDLDDAELDALVAYLQESAG